jgi:hypothetical protein
MLSGRNKTSYRITKSKKAVKCMESYLKRVKEGNYYDEEEEQ